MLTFELNQNMELSSSNSRITLVKKPFIPETPNLETLIDGDIQTDDVEEGAVAKV